MKVSKKNKIIAAIIAVIILSIGYIMQLNGIFNSINNQLHQIFAPHNTIQHTQSKITKDEAVMIALNHANAKSSEASFLRAEKELDEGFVFYEISFNIGHLEYDYTINEANGEILEYSIDNE